MVVEKANIKVKKGSNSKFKNIFI